MSPDAKGELNSIRWIVPMKPLPFAKMRLREDDDLPVYVVDALVLMMLKTVLAALLDQSRKKGFTGYPVVVGGDEPIQRIAWEVGIPWEPDRGADLNETLAIMMREAFAAGYDAAAYLPGDVAMLRDSDLFEIAYAGRMLKRPVGVPAEQDGGTNALLIPAGVDMLPQLGGKSYARHRQAAKDAGTKIRTMNLPHLALDIDTSDDVDEFRRSWPLLDDVLVEWTQWILDGMEEVSPPTLNPFRQRILYSRPDEEDEP